MTTTEAEARRGFRKAWALVVAAVVVLVVTAAIVLVKINADRDRVTNEGNDLSCQLVPTTSC